MPLCPADCGRWFETDRSLNSHLNQAQSCKWYRSYQKSAAIESFTTQLDQEALGDEYMEREISDTALDIGDTTPEIADDEAGEILREFEEEHDIFHFVHVEQNQAALGEAGPGPSTQAHRDSLADRQLGAKVRSFDTEDLKMFEVEHPTAGARIRMDESLYERWRASHDFSNDIPMDGSDAKPNNIYAPFASEMDWRIADWVVKDNIGHNSLNRLLGIPGVSVFYFYLLESLTKFCRWWRNLVYRTRTSQVFTNAWILYAHGRASGWFDVWLLPIALMRNSFFVTAMLLRW
jgi:hypothetical protein